MYETGKCGVFGGANQEDWLMGVRLLIASHRNPVRNEGAPTCTFSRNRKINFGPGLEQEAPQNTTVLRFSFSSYLLLQRKLLIPLSFGSHSLWMPRLAKLEKGPTGKTTTGLGFL